MAYYITPYEQQVLDYVKQYLLEHEYAPTQEEIGKALGKSRSLVEYYLNQLEKKEKIKTPKKKARNIQLV